MRSSKTMPEHGQIKHDTEAIYLSREELLEFQEKRWLQEVRRGGSLDGDSGLGCDANGCDDAPAHLRHSTPEMGRAQAAAQQ